MYLISIYFDEKLDKEIHRLIQKVANVTGNQFMIENHVPPHITVAAVETKHEDVLISTVEDVVNQLSKGDIQLVSVGSFSSQVLFVQPVLNEYLHMLTDLFFQ